MCIYAPFPAVHSCLGCILEGLGDFIKSVPTYVNETQQQLTSMWFSSPARDPQFWTSCEDYAKECHLSLIYDAKAILPVSWSNRTESRDFGSEEDVCSTILVVPPQLSNKSYYPSRHLLLPFLSAVTAAAVLLIKICRKPRWVSSKVPHSSW